ncbi:MAG: NAD(P)-dependent oxidoreductase [Deltaproteobacteria bacterium]|nr:NAD(P)-dependent oxidoreductase [Deltaproteobacteria bacterium]
MSRIIALTGATGFIGSAVARQIDGAGWQVRALVRPESHKNRLDGIAAQWTEGDLDNIESLRRLVHGAYAVVHCAGAVRGATQDHFNRVNVDGVARLVKVATEKKTVPRFLLISSLAAREPQLSPYATSKRLGEKALVEGAGKMPWAALRPSAVYGPGDREMLPLFRWMERGIAPVLGSESARFSLLYVEDLAAAVLRWLDSENCAARHFELHDGHPQGYTWDAVIDTAAHLRGGPIVRLQVPVLVPKLLAVVNLMAARVMGYAPMLTPGKVCELRHPDWVCNNAPFFHETGWKPKISLEQGLRNTLRQNKGP